MALGPSFQFVVHGHCLFGQHVDTIGSTAHPKTGKPQIITDADGSTFVRGSLLTELKIPLKPSTSLYAVIGDWGIIGLSVIGIVLAFACRKHNAIAT